MLYMNITYTLRLYIVFRVKKKPSVLALFPFRFFFLCSHTLEIEIVRARAYTTQKDRRTDQYACKVQRTRTANNDQNGYNVCSFISCFTDFIKLFFHSLLCCMLIMCTYKHTIAWTTHHHYSIIIVLCIAHDSIQRNRIQNLFVLSFNLAHHQLRAKRIFHVLHWVCCSSLFQ